MEVGCLLISLQVSESREALAHQRLAARLLALRTQQLENQLSQVSDVTANNVGHLDDSGEVENEVSQVLENCATANDTHSLREGDNIVEDKLSQVSHNSVTPTGASCLGEDSKLDACDQTRKFSCMQLDDSSTDAARGSVSSKQAHSNGAVYLAVSRDESTADKNAVVPETCSNDALLT